MKKYKVVFEFRNAIGEWISDYLSNDGHGFTEEEAKDVRIDIILGSVNTRGVEVVEL